MKTNQLMNIAFNSGTVEVFHKTAMGNLTQLWSAGNGLRLNEGKSVANLSNFLKSAKTVEFMAALSSQGIVPIETTGVGNTKRTWACLELMIYAAEYVSVAFHVEVIQTFIKGKILDFRDESGDNFKAMNIAIDSYLPEREGKDNKGVRIQIAKQIRHKVNPELINWNLANADELKFRCEIEDRITSILKLDLINNYEHLKAIVNSM
jgi:hypothetical protein